MTNHRSATSIVPGLTSSKITQEHLTRQGLLYVRQSTSHQLREHQESTERQYQLTKRLVALGWPLERVVVIDEDLGISGTGKVQRPGFRRLLNLVTEQQAGIVLGLEMSRLARNSRDWQELFEVCAVFRTLIADEDGLFDPNDPNDRLILGLKGIISEMELHTMKVRLERGRLNKAQRGELFHDMPVGYVRDERGLAVFDPDVSAQHAMRMFFSLFESVGSSHGLFHHLAEHNIKLPFRDRGGPIDWRVPARTTVYELLRHPLYAGTYGYGKKKNYRTKSGNPSSKKHLPPSEWKVLRKEQFPAYITWQQFESHQERLRENDARGGDRTGAPRNGTALLTGMVFCEHCGRRLTPVYSSSNTVSYYCTRHRTVAGATSCQNGISSATLDSFVSEKLLEALSPAAVEFSLQVIEDESTRREQLDTLHVHRVQQAQYAVDLAHRRYQAVDPANRLVTARLEQDWEAALQSLQKVTGELEQLRRTQPVPLLEGQRRQLLDACRNVSTLWSSQASITDRKQIARLLLKRVTVQVMNGSDRTRVVLHWSGGFQTEHEIMRPVTSYTQLESFSDLQNRILALTKAGHSAPETARILQSEGYRSPRAQQYLSTFMVQKLLAEPRCVQELNEPQLSQDQWRSEDLARKLKIPEKRLKDWVTRGWVNAIQRPHGRTWVLFANAAELKRLRQLVKSQAGQGSPAPPETLRKPAPLPRLES